MYKPICSCGAARCRMRIKNVRHAFPSHGRDRRARVQFEDVVHVVQKLRKLVLLSVVHVHFRKICKLGVYGRCFIFTGLEIFRNKITQCSDSVSSSMDKFIELKLCCILLHSCSCCNRELVSCFLVRIKKSKIHGVFAKLIEKGTIVAVYVLLLHL